MKRTYKVTLTRTSYAMHDFEVEASSEEQAAELARQAGANYGGWTENNAEYDVEFIESKDEETAN